MTGLPDDITYRRLAFDDAVAQGGEALLSPEERERLTSFSHPRRQHEFVAGRVAARLLLAEHLALPPAEVPLRTAENGAPDVTGHDVHLSIAHSGHEAVAAVARRPVGIDLEVIRPRHVNLHRYLLHESEYPLLDASELPRDHTLILCWTLKEATLKGLQLGLRHAPKLLRLNLDWPQQRATVDAKEHGQWTAHFERQNGSFLAIAYPEQG